MLGLWFQKGEQDLEDGVERIPSNLLLCIQYMRSRLIEAELRPESFTYNYFVCMNSNELIDSQQSLFWNPDYAT
jgi:hypothetical protein